jgi:CDP-glucose 4,6-dehydratase
MIFGMGKTQLGAFGDKHSMTARPQASYWNGKKVLVTGHTGFKGAWLCLMLRHMGAHVYGYSLAEETPSLFAQARVRELLTDEHIGDVCDLHAVCNFMREAEPEIVIHFAAHALVRQCYREPVQSFQTNLIGTTHILEAVRLSQGVKVLLIATTDKVYYNDESGVPFRESDGLGGIEPYSASKAAAEMAVAAYRTSYLESKGIAVPVCRAGNVIGGGDWSSERIVPDIVRSVMAGTTLSVRSPRSVRPWQSVLDALTGYLVLVEKSGQLPVPVLHPHDAAFNFGPPVEHTFVTVAEICNWAQSCWPGRFSWLTENDREGIAESKLLALDPGKAAAMLGWTPQLNPEQAVRHTLEWYIAHLEGKDARDLCIEQIDRHFQATA